MIPYDGRTAAVRYNNPGAQYPSPHTRRFGSTGHGMIAGGHKIAYFPSEAHGAAANMDNFARNYRGMRLGDAVTKWRGGKGNLAVPHGFDANSMVDDAFLGDRDRMTRFFTGMSVNEGRGSAPPVSAESWGQGFDWYRAGGAPVGGQTMQPLGMLRPRGTPAATPAPAAPATAADPNALSAISPEYMKTLASMGLLGSRNRQAPRNVGEALSQLGDKIFDRATMSHVLGELRRGTAAENAAWGAYGSNSAPAAPAAPQLPATGSPRGPGGMLTAGLSFGSNPSPTAAPDYSRPLIAGGMVAPGVSAGGFNGEAVRSEDMAPPAAPVGMVGGGGQLTSAAAEPASQPVIAPPPLGMLRGAVSEPPSQEPARSPVPLGMFAGGERLAADGASDPQLAEVDAQIAHARRFVAHPSSNIAQQAREDLRQLQEKRTTLLDPMRPLQRRLQTAHAELYEAQASKARREADTSSSGFKDGKQVADVEESLRKEFSSHAKPYFETRDAYSRIQQAASNPTPAGDMALIYNIMKMYDPGSVVREGEFATAQNATGVPDRVINTYNQLLRGTRLNPEQRADFLGQAEKIFTVTSQQYDAVQQQYRDIAVRKGIDPRNVFIDYRIPRAGKKEDRLPQAAGAPRAIASDAEYEALPPGAEYVAPDGNVRRKR